MIERRATLLVDKKFEGNFSLKKGTPIFVEEMKSGWWAGHYYPDPTKHSSHSFNVEPDEFSLWVRANTDEPYLVIAEEDPPNEAEIAKIREIEIHQARKRVELTAERYDEARTELEELLR